MADDSLDLAEARDRYQLWCDAEKEQLDRETDDCAFYDGKQWPDEYINIRKGSEGSGSVPPTPARPCITINEVKDPARHVMNDLLQTDFGISVVPADDWGAPTLSADEITLREGLIRRIQRQSNSQSAMMWAAERAVIAGRGYFGFNTRYVRPPTGDAATILAAGASLFDQEVVFRRFYDQAAVALDPAHEEPDGSDAEWGFVRSWMPWGEYKSKRRKTASGDPNPLARATNKDFSDWAAKLPKWFQIQGTKERNILVVEYWRYEYDTLDVVLLNDGTAVGAKSLPREFLKTVSEDRRQKLTIKRVRRDLIDGMNDDVLEPTVEWPGRYLPLVKVLGEEIQPYDSQKRAEGIVRPGREANQAENYMVSKAVETIGQAPNAPVQAYAGQFEGFEDMWNAATMGRPVGRLESNAKTPATGDVILPLPQLLTREPPIQALAGMIPVFKAAVRSTMGIPDPMLGQVNPAVRSGDAIKAVIDAALRGTSNYSENFIVSLKRAGVILNDLLKPIYNNRPGRIVQLMNGTNDTLPVMLQTPHVVQNGAPIAVGMQPGQMPPNAPEAANAKKYELTDMGANSNIAVKVVKHFETQREEQHRLLGELIQSNPQMFMSFFGDLYFAGSDLANAPELVNRAKLMLAPPVQQMLAQGTPPDPKMAAQLQQSGEIIKQLTAHIEELQRKIQAKETESAAMLARAEMDNSTKIAVAQIQTGNQQAIAQMNAAVDMMNQQLERHYEGIRLMLEGQQEHRLAEKEHIHTLETQRAQHGHDLHQLAHEQQHEQDLAALEPQVETT